MGKDINVNGTGGKPESAEELKKKQEAEKLRANEQNKNNINNDITTGLTGNKIDFSALNSGLGFGGIFGASQLNVNEQELADLSKSFLGFTMNMSNMPFGMGEDFMSSAMSNWFQSFMGCFTSSTTNTTTTTKPELETKTNETKTTLVDKNKVEEKDKTDKTNVENEEKVNVEEKKDKPHVETPQEKKVRLEAEAKKEAKALGYTGSTANMTSIVKSTNEKYYNATVNGKTVMRKADGSEYTQTDMARDLVTNPKIKDKNDWSVLYDGNFSKESLDLAMSSDTCKKKIGNGSLSYEKKDDGSVVVKRNYRDSYGHTNTDAYTITFDKSGKPKQINESQKIFDHIDNSGKQVFNTNSKSVKFKDGVAIPQEAEKPKTKELAKKEASTSKADYKKTSVEGFYIKDGAYYKYSLETGKYNKCDMVYSDGRYVMNGVTYKSDTTPADATVCAHKGQPSINTINHYVGNGYSSEKRSDGGKVLTSKDGYETLIFDKTGKLTRQIYDNKGGGFFGSPKKSTTDYVYNDKSQVAKVIVSDLTKRLTETTEYITNTKNLKEGVTSTKSQPYTQQEMNSNGKVSAYKLQDSSTVSVKIENGIAIKKTITQTSIVK